MVLMGLAFFAIAPGSALAQNYRTVVVFGDTQTAVSNDPAQNADFAAQIDWVIANKHTENIDFVLHVGDIIDLGTFLPLPNVCAGAPAVTFCNPGGNPCNSPPSGCFSVAVPGGSVCLSCNGILDATDDQWSRFNTQWSRLEPNVAAGWEGLPYAIVRGNHDNIGTSSASDVDVVGYNQYYSAAQMEALETSFIGLDRSYEHLATYPSSTEGNGHAWRFELGGRPVVVVGPSYEGGGNISTAQINWTSDIFVEHADTAGILLVHDAIEFSQINNAIVNQMDTAAPGLIWAAQGHIGQDTKRVDTIQGYKVIRSVSDWSRISSPGGSYFAVFRFYLEAGQDDELEAFSYSPVLDQQLTAPDRTILKQPFPVPVPEPSMLTLQISGLAGLLLFRIWGR